MFWGEVQLDGGNFYIGRAEQLVTTIPAIEPLSKLLSSHWNGTVPRSTPTSNYHDSNVLYPGLIDLLLP